MNPIKTSLPNEAPTLKLFINGEFVESKSNEWFDLHDPATNNVLIRVPMSTKEEVDAAVESCKKAYESWKNTSVLTRQQFMFKLQTVLQRDLKKLAAHITLEGGKTLEDSEADLIRGIQVVEHACAAASLLQGESLQTVAQDMDMMSYKVPLGVTAGICPFNFPAMIPLFMFPLALVAGNTMVLKPSERVAGTSLLLAEILQEVGLPPGVVNIVHGARDVSNFICEHPDVKAISFIGGDEAGKNVYERGTKNGKRVQANLSAKNHCIVMPDADKNATLAGIVGAAYGGEGQRCMSLTVAILVGESKNWIPELVEKAKQLKVNAGHEPGTDFGPVISPERKQKICNLIETSLKQGAKCVLDGRNIKIEKYPNGNFIGPTILTNVQTNHACYKEELFGPVLSVMTADTFEEALEIINTNPYGNGAGIFTTSGNHARRFTIEVEQGHVGINIALPVPLPMFSFTGWKGSFLGDFHTYGKQGLDFYTETKTITTLWRKEAAPVSSRASVTMPVQI